MGYKYHVCKGDKLVAKTTTLKEAKAEAKRVGGHYEPITRNPLDSDYTVKLGEGAFSAAYRRDFDPGAKGVQNLTAVRRGGSADIAKVILIEARKALRGNRKAQAYLPNIRPVRIDFTNPDRPEFIYTQPLLSPPWRKFRQGATPALVEIARAVDGHLNHNFGVTLDKVAQKVKSNLAKATDPKARKEADALADALNAVHTQAMKYYGPYKGHRYSADIHDENYGLNRKGDHIVVFDPMVYSMSLDSAVKLWNDLGYPNGTPKAPKAPKAPKKAPKAPATAKLPRGKGKAKGKLPSAKGEQKIRAKFRNAKDLYLFFIGFAEAGKLWPDMTAADADMVADGKSDRLWAFSQKVPSWLFDRLLFTAEQLMGKGLRRETGTKTYTLDATNKQVKDVLLQAKRDVPKR